MKVLFGCEESQEGTIAFREQGHEAFSCDLQASSGGHPEWHLQGDIFYYLNWMDWDLLIAHPPCTFLTVANTYITRGCGKYTATEAKGMQLDAIEFF